ncbi:MAG: RNA polymerase sigma factor [Pseudonocardiaceae bacterium]
MTTTELPTLTTTCVSQKTDLAELVAGATAGCATSWREIVNRFDDHLQRTARARGLDGPTAADVVQQTWLAAIANIEALRTAQALGGWLRSILYRECLKVLTLRNQETPHVDEIDLTGYAHGRTVVMCTEPRSPEEETLLREQGRLVHTARRRLSRRDQDLLELLVVDPPLPYTEISRRLGVPIGSIGPTRARCFARLRRELATLGVNSGYSAGNDHRGPRRGRSMR